MHRSRYSRGRRCCGVVQALVFLLLTWGGASFFPASLSAQSVRQIVKLPPDLPWEILADVVEYDSQADVYLARDGVAISRGPVRLTADFVRFAHKTLDAMAEGNVMVTTGEDVLTGRRLEINLGTQTGVLYSGTLFVKENHFYIAGDRIEKVGRREYRVRAASLTSCDGSVPDWKITGKNLEVTLEGYGTVNHAAFWVKDVPVMYAPFFVFPAKLKRQTGLLTPEVGNSDRRGIEYQQPFFWAIDESQDLTLYNHYMSERGDKIGVEYRYALADRARGTLMFDYLDDRKIDDGAGDSSRDYGYDGDTEIRTNADRYWFRGKIDQPLPLDVNARLDIDVVSDQDYLYEFKGGYSGYDQTNRDFRRHFGRDLDDYTDPVRANRLSFHRLWPDYSLDAEFLWYDDVIRRRWRDEDTTLQALPYLSLNSSKQAIVGTPFFWNADTQYAHFYRQDGARGHRFDLHPRLYWPKHLAPYLFVEPSLGYRQTVWRMDEFDPDDDLEDRDHHRELMDGRIDLFTQFFRHYDVSDTDETDGGWRGVSAIRHNVRPQITYEYIPETDQDAYPFFDPLDRITARNRITFALVNTLVSKSFGAARTSGYDDPETASSDVAAAPPVYRQFLRFELRQSYDFNTYEDDPEYMFFDRSTPEVGTHLSPLYARLTVTPADYLAIRAEGQWSHEADRVLSNNVAMNLRDDRGDHATAEYRYTRDFSESLYGALTLRLTPRWTTLAEYEHNLKDDENIKTGFGVRYAAQCWAVNFRYLKERDDDSFGVMVDLFGLGGVGSE